MVTKKVTENRSRLQAPNPRKTKLHKQLRSLAEKAFKSLPAPQARMQQYGSTQKRLKALSSEIGRGAALSHEINRRVMSGAQQKQRTSKPRPTVRRGPASRSRLRFGGK